MGSDMRRYSLRCRAFSLSLFLLVGCGSFGTASAQLINNDAGKNALLAARYAAMEAALAETLQAAREEEENATTEMQKADELLKQTLARLIDRAPGYKQRLKDWAEIEALLTGTCVLVFKHDNASVWKDQIAQIRKKLFVLPDAADVKGDVVWRRYKNQFIRLEKALLGKSELEGIEDLVDSAEGVVAGEVGGIAANLMQRIQGMSNKKTTGLIEAGYIANQVIEDAYTEDLHRIIEDVKAMHNSWVSSADKDKFYSMKLTELNRLYGLARRGNWVDYILSSESVDRKVISDDYRRLIDSGKSE